MLDKCNQNYCILIILESIVTTSESQYWMKTCIYYWNWNHSLPTSNLSFRSLNKYWKWRKPKLRRSIWGNNQLAFAGRQPEIVFCLLGGYRTPRFNSTHVHCVCFIHPLWFRRNQGKYYTESIDKNTKIHKADCKKVY